MRTILLSLAIVFSFQVIGANKYDGCVLQNTSASQKLTVQTGDAIGQTFTPCSEGFLNHFSVYTDQITSTKEKCFLNIYEIIDNKFQFLHQEKEILPEQIQEGCLTFWVKGRVPLFEGREYAAEIISLSNSSYDLVYNSNDEFLGGAMVVNGSFTFSDLKFDIGIKESLKSPHKEREKISLKNQNTLSASPLFQSWSNKSLTLKLGDLGQSFQVDKRTGVSSFGIKIRNINSSCEANFEIYQGGLDLGQKIHTQELEFESARGENWLKFELSKQLFLESETQYFFLLKFENPESEVKFYYSTADPFDNGNMIMSGLAVKDCDLSFFIETASDDFLKEIAWLEENNFENLEDSPLSKKIAIETKFDANAFPNPFEGQFMLSYENFKPSEMVYLAITNSSGTVLWSSEFFVDSKNGVQTINPEITFPSGKYNLRIAHNGDIIYKSIISR